LTFTIINAESVELTSCFQL